MAYKDNNGTGSGNNKGRALAQFLGWFSIGLGLAEMLAPRALGEMIGINETEHDILIRGLGLREVTSGIAILTQVSQAEWVGSRVAGDMIDLALLGVASQSKANDGARVGMAAAMVAGVTALDVLCAKQLSSQ